MNTCKGVESATLSSKSYELAIYLFCWQVSRSDLRDLLLQCCADEAPDVRQSALALLGDLVKVVYFGNWLSDCFLYT